MEQYALPRHQQGTIPDRWGQESAPCDRNKRNCLEHSELQGFSGRRNRRESICDISWQYLRQYPFRHMPSHKVGLQQQSPARRKIPLRYLSSKRSKITLQRHFLKFLSPYYDNAGRKYLEKHLCKTITSINIFLWFTEYYVAFPPMHRD